MKGPDDGIYALTLTPSGRSIIAWGGQNAEIDVLDRESGQQARRERTNDRPITCLAFSPDGELAAMGDNGGTVRIWSVAKNERLGGDLPAHKAIGDLILTPDKKFLITGGEDGEIKAWDLAKRTTVWTIKKGHAKKIVAFAVSNDGRRFATASQNQDVKLWDTASGKELRTWKGVAVRNMAFAPDGKHVATANFNTTLYLLECP
jgi:WD40 repeat protein